VSGLTHLLVNNSPDAISVLTPGLTVSVLILSSSHDIDKLADTHPALGGGFGPGHVIVGGTDLVGDNFNGTNTPVPDNDPLDQCVGHGTHVAVSPLSSLITSGAHTQQ
jgi:hypothetical protein